MAGAAEQPLQPTSGREAPGHYPDRERRRSRLIGEPLGGPIV
jgi:hypothetical protein